MPAKRPGDKAISADRAMLAANKFILFKYPNMFTGGLPHRLSLQTSEIWIVPLVLTHPDHGIVGEIGSVAVDLHTNEILGYTPRAEAVAAAQHLREAKGYARETALLSTRAV
jgi:hypothetical protein